MGAVLLLGADVVGRLIDPTGAELPVGAVTAMIGSPWLIYLVYRMMKSKQYMNDNGANAAGASSRYYSYKKGHHYIYHTLYCDDCSWCYNR